jgi:hypothetical protein
LCAVFIAGSLAYAQEEGKDDHGPKIHGWEYGVHTGPLLPNQITGVTEIMPMWGARVSFPSRKAMIEVGLSNARAYGITMYDGSLSYRGDVTVESLTGIFYLGLDFNHITDATGSTQMVGGGHVGAGLMTLIGDSLWFRTDMKFNVNPGTSLYIGFGLVFRMPGGEAGGDAGASGQ